MTFRQPKLLPDEPAIEDSFGAHERIANAIAALIETSEGGKSIHLDGEWGAGKSTVVQMLRKRLSANRAPESEKDPRTRTFVYDAWIHSGDGVRRAFFESLVNDLLACEWIRPKSKSASEWKAKLDTFSGKSKRTTKRSKPEFAAGTRVALALGVTGALLSPILYNLISKALQDSPTWLLWSLTGCSAAILFCSVIGISAKNVQVLLTKSTQDETTDTLTEPVPTSIEFQQEFGRLMSDVLNPRERKLVIVIDNLDRVEPDEAKQVWILLRSFLDNPAFRENEWFKRLWLLVPIAGESYLSKLSVGGESGGGKGNTLEKVFQVRMSLPLPMLRPWKGFLARKLADCFGADEDGSYEVIARLFHASAARAAPTPRQLVVFINELVALYTERQGDMPLSTLAAYILSRDQVRARPWQVPTDIAKVHYPPTLEQDFATLYLHAEKSPDSLYLLILPNLQRALEMGEPSDLYRVLESSPAAHDILDQYLIDSLTRMSQSSEEAQKEQALFLAYLRALVMFIEPALSGHFSAGFLNHIRPRIDRVMALTNSLDLSNPNIAGGVDAYLQLTNDASFATAKVSSLLHAISAIPDTNSPIAPGAWDLWTRSLNELLSNQRIRTAATLSESRHISLPIPIERWVAICESLEAEPVGAAVLAMIDVSADNEKLSDWIVTESLPMNVDNRAGRVLRQELRTRGSEFFQLVTKKTAEVFRARADLPRSEVLACLVYLVEVSKEYARPFLKELTDEGMFLQWVRHNSTSPSFTTDEHFIRFAALSIWSQGDLASARPDNFAISVATAMRNLFRTGAPTPGSVVKVANELILRTKIYDVLPIIAVIAGGAHEVLDQMLFGLCANAEFFNAARAELSGDSCASSSQFLLGEGAEVVRKLLSQKVEHFQRLHSLPKEQTV
ncbi:P-loop NTPase fold protein [Paraburkholderia aspalathi]|uniref:P-loop NTPase fold protein n=1 Tax=Paraburkholderia aspalathi TaxID=1324617 RepID=UPI0038BBA747